MTAGRKGVAPPAACLVMSRAPVLTWMADDEGRVVFLSAYWADFTGVPVAKLLAGSVLDVVHPDDRHVFFGSLRGLEKSSARVVREYRLRRADGLWRTVQDSALPVLDEEGEPFAHVGVCDDVTERHEFLSVVRFQRSVSACLAATRSREELLESLLETICAEGGFDEAAICRVSGASPTRLLLRRSAAGSETSECTCWRATEIATSPTFRPACSRVSVPVVGSYPIVVSGEVTALLTLGSRRASDVFLPLLESLTGTAAILGAMLGRSEVEERLRTSEKRYRALLEQSSEGIFTFDPATHRVLEANRRFLQITGYAPEEIGSLTLEKLLSGDAASIAEGVSRAVDGRAGFVGERNYRTRDGGSVAVEASASLVTWADGQVVLVNVRDVSETRAGVRTLAELSQRHRLILDSASEGILGLDVDGKITFVNRAAAELVGWSAAELLGANGHAYLHHTRHDGRSHPLEECPVLSTIRAGVRVAVSDDVFWKKDGSSFPVRYEASPKWEEGRAVGAVVVFRDVSREERLESIAAAVESMNSLGYVFSAVRHELGNPVNSVKTALTVLRQNLDRFEPATTRGFIDRSLAELSRVEELLASLRTFGLYEDVQLRGLDLAAFAREFVEFASGDLAGRGVTLELEAGDAPVFAAADPRALRHVLLNLVANSAEAMGEKGGHVRLEVESRGEWAALRVEDDGAGMGAEALRNLFQPFYTSKVKGTGLGLVIARKMMTSMGGTIDVASSPGAGTTMTLSLRTAAPPDREEPPAGRRT